jgi:predicted enzyme related to lactoylglutathione lyase
MLEKVFYTSVLVSDQDKALDFYTNTLGLEKRVENPTPDGPRFLTVGVEGDDFQLVLWPGTPGQAEPAMGRPPASITIETDDCHRTVASSSSPTCSSSPGATSRSSRTPTATGYSSGRAVSQRQAAHCGRWRQAGTRRPQ